MFEFIKSSIRVGMFLLVIMLITTASESNNMNFAGTAKKELSKQETIKIKRKEIEGRIFYLQTNIWNEAGKDILSTNFHRGRVIPVGAEVTIDRMKRGAIIFTVNATIIQYNFVLAKRHSKLDIFELFARYFGQTNPLEDSFYNSLNSSEQEHINLGRVCFGMTKESVIMSYGYPPTHKTPVLSSDEWTYWESRAKRMIIFFKDDKVIEVKGYRFSCNE